ncbi:MAG: ABC transporter permease [Bacteroidales bacterium]|nr:ABC transporter permease [Bacteroidales bacterium]MCF8386615.1 ABC transporter permease [Bacteroidales bacterium]MCF8397731.1 ABC transporter permease [Bacteroidales bacterium]
MNIRDLIKIGFSNLWQTKLRSILTILGVVIGIGALSSMISFGTGIQKNITDAFKNNDLFTSMNVTAAKIGMDDIQHPDPGRIRDAMKEKKAPLNDSTLELIRNVEGVAIAHPEIILPCKLVMGEKNTSTRAQALPAAMGKYKPYKDLMAGTFLLSDTGRQMVLSWETMRRLGYVCIDDKQNKLSKKDSSENRILVNADTMIGKKLFLVAATIDVKKVMKNPFAMMNGAGEEAFSEDSTVFTLTGILKRSGPFGSGDIKGGAVIPAKTASEIPTLGFSSIWDILSPGKDENQYSSIYVRVGDIQEMGRIRKEIEDMDMHVFSISDQLEEIKRGFLIMDSILGAIGVVALLIAALGIINTMVMSILERTREIGIMKAIGGSDREIKTIFFVEAGSIGLIGAIFGLLLGWLFTRVATLVINNYIVPDDEVAVDLFYFPIWLILGAIAFSILISLAAGLYPAARAARIDPVKALRHD